MAREAGCRVLIASSLAALVSLGCVHTHAAQGPSEGGKALLPLAQRYIDFRLRTKPVWATSVGFHAYDHQLGSYGIEDRERELVWLDAYAGELEQKVQPSQLNPEERADWDLLTGQVNTDRLAIRERKLLERNPSEWLRLAAQSIHLLLLRDFAPLSERMAAAADRLEAWPALLSQARASLKHPPRIWTELAFEQVEGVQALLRTQVPEAFVSVENVELQAKLQHALGKAQEALATFTFFLRDELLPRSNGSFALGPELFARVLAAEEGVTLPLDELWRWGETEMTQTQTAFTEAARRVSADRPAAEVFQSLGEEHPPPDGLLGEAEKTMLELRGFVQSRALVTLPPDPVVHVAATPRFVTALSFASLNMPGPLEQKARDAFYFVTVPDPNWPAKRVQQHMTFFSRAALPLVTAHEVFPGHYIQLSRREALASPIRRLLGTTAVSEGWGLYAEALVTDAGYGAPALQDRLRLARLGMYLQRLARFRVSLGLHTRGMSYPDAVKLFMQEAHLSQANAEREAKRGTVDPLYLSYALGYREIMRLREEVHRREGGRFSLQKFHDELLGLGQPPVSSLRRLMLGEP
jgi:uncharacterized protein (DUF885 family)